MSVPIPLQELVAHAVRAYPGAQLEWDPLPSGVCFFWTSLNGRAFVIEYDPQRGTGVSEDLDDTPPFVGHTEVYSSLEAGIRRFEALMADAARFPAQSTAAFAFHDKPISP